MSAWNEDDQRRLQEKSMAKNFGLTPISGPTDSGSGSGSSQTGTVGVTGGADFGRSYEGYVDPSGGTGDTGFGRGGTGTVPPAGVNDVARFLRGDNQQRNTTLPVGGDSQNVITTTPPAAQGRIYQGFTPVHPMEGFDFAREQNTGKSAKDAFADLANQAPPPPLNDKAALEAWFNQYIAPGMNALGHNVSNVQGDKFRLSNWQGDFDVDYGRGAGAEGGALAWMADPAGGAPDAAAAPNGGLARAAQFLRAPAGGGDTATDRVLAEIEALINNQSTPMQQDALAQLFGI